MNLDTLTGLFSGSSLKLLRQHRKLVLDTLLSLNRQVQCLSAENPQSLMAKPWDSELPQQLQKLERNLHHRLERTSAVSKSKSTALNAVQVQSHLAQQILRLSERLAARPLRLPVELVMPVNELTRQFGKTVCQLRKEVVGKDDGILKKVEFSYLAQNIEHLGNLSLSLKEGIYQFDSSIEIVDAALLFLILDDINDISLWMRELLKLQQSD